MSGRLYIVGTPIGNLGDMSFRAVKTLEGVDFIAAEDTRVTLKLLNYFKIKKPMVSYHEHNHKYSGEIIFKRIMAGESCAVVTDAGMPCISDPGEDLVRLCAENGIETQVIPGPSALVAALAVSGLDTSRFAFEGFLSVAKRSRRERLEECAREPRTLIFYEAPHKLAATLEDLRLFLSDRKITICRELTKLHEEIIRTTLDSAVTLYNEDSPPRGEYVLIVEGYHEKKEERMTEEDALARVKELIAGGARPTDACREAARESGMTKSRLYSLLLEDKTDAASEDKEH